MTDEMQTRWKSMQRELDQLLQDLSVYDNVLLNQKPAQDKWSVLQTMVHVMRSEKLGMRYLKKKLQNQRDFPKAGLASAWRSWVLQGALRSPFKFKAPQAVSGPNLPEESSLEEIAEEWSATRSDLEQLLRAIPAELYGKAIYRHPFVGLLTLPDMLEFLEGHFLRHRRQMYRTLESVRSK